MRQRIERIKDEAHLRFIRDLPCAICGNNIETQAAHLRTNDRSWGKDITGGGRKPSDMWVTPLCGRHHDEQHQVGDELKFWDFHGINPFPLALSLYAASGNHELALEVIEARGRER